MFVKLMAKREPELLEEIVLSEAERETGKAIAFARRELRGD